MQSTIIPLLPRRARPVAFGTAVWIFGGVLVYTAWKFAFGNKDNEDYDPNGGVVRLYFLLGGQVEKLVYLFYGLAVILGFIGVKLVLHALHKNELPFINGGEHVAWALEINNWVSLAVIITVLTITTVASLLKSRRDTRLAAGQSVSEPAGFDLATFTEQLWSDSQSAISRARH
ncbi:hypothetical protein [Nonomuraea sp. B1E8]|uniref:hypothetical protein n=1 Tax=unclassified Nonomuraea TaxID=2593643 RepID=UPI00325C9200